MISSKKFVFFIPLLFVLLQIWCDTRFSDPDLSDENTLLFLATHSESYDRGNYSALVAADLEKDTVKLLTYYPEEHFFSGDSRELFIWNRFGFYIFSGTEPSLPKRMDIYPSLETGSPVQLGKLAPVSISPDGKYFLYYRQTDWSRGDLLLFDRERGFSRLVTSEVTMDYDGNSIRWSSDSRFFAYVKEGSLYYLSMEKFIQERLPEEETRRLGKGGPGSFRWGGDNSLYYIVGSEVLSVKANEMFALSFYDSPLQVGTVAGQLFFDFNANFDNFWISPDRNHLLVKREGGALFLINLEFRNYNDYGEIKRFPFLTLPAGYDVKKVVWADSGKVYLLVGSELDREKGNNLYVYDPDDSLDSFAEKKQKGVIDIALSPDQRNLAVLYDNELTVRDNRRWTLLRSLASGENLSCYWGDDDNLVLLGKRQSSLYNIVSDSKDVLFFSQCEDYGFSLDGQIQLTSGGENYILNNGTGKWRSTEDYFYRERSVYSDKFRIFLTENNHPVVYSNMIMIRKAQEYGTVPLLSDMEQELATP